MQENKRYPHQCGRNLRESISLGKKLLSTNKVQIKLLMKSSCSTEVEVEHTVQQPNVIKTIQSVLMEAKFRGKIQQK